MISSCINVGFNRGIKTVKRSTLSLMKDIGDQAVSKYWSKKIYRYVKFFTDGLNKR